MNTIKRRFGTFRGLVRTALGYAELASGRLAPFQLKDPAAVRRVVFVCHGNICRSAYAHQIANRLGMQVASLGLSTTTGNASPKVALGAAKRLGIDMAAHRACDWRDFEVQNGDLFLVMEVRQAHEMRRRLVQRLGSLEHVQVSLLGLWGQPVMPHLHDPYTLSDAYFDTCFKRVELSVERLAKALPQLRRAGGGFDAPGAALARQG